MGAARLTNISWQPCREGVGVIKQFRLGDFQLFFFTEYHHNKHLTEEDFRRVVSAFTMATRGF